MLRLQMHAWLGWDLSQIGPKSLRFCFSWCPIIPDAAACVSVGSGGGGGCEGPVNQRLGMDHT